MNINAQVAPVPIHGIARRGDTIMHLVAKAGLERAIQFFMMYCEDPSLNTQDYRGRFPVELLLKEYCLTERPEDGDIYDEVAAKMIRQMNTNK